MREYIVDLADVSAYGRLMITGNGIPNKELVRCKDCKYYDAGENDSESWTWCKFHETSMHSTDFCNYGKRKEE